MSYVPLFVKEGGVLKKIDLEEVLVLEVDNNYVRFITMQREFTVQLSLKQALEAMPEGSFVQINRACAVAVRHIEEISGTHVVVAGKGLVVSRGYYAGVRGMVRVLG